MRIILTLINLLFMSAVFFIPPGYSQQGNPAGTGFIIKEEKGFKREKLEEEIRTINFLNNIDLRKEQLEFIIDKAKEIDKKTKDLYREYQRDSELLFRAEKEIKRQVLSGRIKVSKPLYKKWMLANERCNRVFYKHNDLVEEAVKIVEGQLKDFQLIAVDNFVPCIVPEQNENFVGQSNKESTFICYVLKKARKIPAEKYEAEKESFAAQQVAYLKNNFCPCSRLVEENAAKKEMLKVFEEVRKLDEVEFKLDMGRIGEELAYKIILVNPPASRAVRIQRFLLSDRCIPILEARLKAKKRP